MWVDLENRVNSLLSQTSPLSVEQPYDLLGMVESASDSSFAKPITHPIHSAMTSNGIHKNDLTVPRTRSKSSSPNITRDSKVGSIHDESTHEMTSDNSIIDLNLSENNTENDGIEISNTNLPKNIDEETDTHKTKNCINIQHLADNFMNEDAYGNMELNSSPIKAASNKSPYRGELSSSPIKKKKSVAFSDDLVSELPSSPAPMTYNSKLPILEQTPKKSILKINLMNQRSSPCNPNDTSLWVKSSNNIHVKNSPSNPKFWILGTIIQLVPNSPDLQQLIEGCISVLKDENFTKKFEVYATLNHICKFNTSDSLLKLLTIQNKSGTNISHSPQKIISKTLMKTNPPPSSMESTYIHTLSTFIQRDVTHIESILFCETEEKENNLSPNKNDPFSIRIISQALKLINFIMLDQELNNFISIEDAKWFYLHSCKIIVKPTISKTLIIPYLSILKDCKFNNKKKKLIFNNQNEDTNILELILQSLLNMRKFVSSSLVVEEFVTLKNLVLNFPVMMANNFKHWFEFFLMNICDLSSPLYSKVINMGILVLLEVARNYLDNKNILFAVRQFLASPLPSNVRSIISHTHISVSSPISNSGNSDEHLVIDFIISSLETLIENGQFKSAMDIWLGITLLSGDSDSGYENWPFLSKWLKVHKSCFNVQNNSAKIIALNSWKAIIFNVCHNDLDSIRHLIDSASNNKNNNSKPQGFNNILKPKVKLLIHPLLNISAVENQKDIIDSSHNLFLSIIYNLLNPVITNNSKYVHIYWDKIIQPVLINFYFKKDLSNAYMNELGLKTLTRLMKTSTTANEKLFNEMRCLSNEPITIQDINSISPRWILSRFDRIMQNINIIFKLEKLNIGSKMEFFNNFLNCIKLITKKEVKPSDATCDIIDNIPNVLNVLLKHNKLSYDLIHKLVVNLNDTFDASNFIDKSVDTGESSSSNVYILIIDSCLADMEINQAIELLGSIYTAIGDKKNLIFLLDLIKLQSHNTHFGLENFIASTLKSRKVNATSNLELEFTGELFQIITKDYEVITKKLTQAIVLLGAAEFERVSNVLKIQSWTLPIFKYFIELVHDAPHPHLKQIPLNLIISRWENNEVFFEIVRFLIDKRFNLELYNLRKNMMKNFKALEGFRQFEFRLIWKSYLSSIVESGNFKLLDDLLVSSYEVGLNVKPHIQNKWDKLPLLKRMWLANNSALYIDNESFQQSSSTSSDNSKDFALDGIYTEDNTKLIDTSNNTKAIPMNDMETIESIENISIPSLFANQNNENINDISEKKTMSPTSDDTQVDSDNLVKVKENKKKVKSTARPKTKKKTNRKVKKEKSPTADTNPNFDIHSFTAMLNAKLSPTTPLKNTTRSTKPSSNKSTQEKVTDESQISKTTHDDTDTVISNHIKNEIQIPSSLNDDGISQSETSSISQNSIHEFDHVDEDSGSPPSRHTKSKIKSPSPRGNDYSKVIQSGFLGCNSPSLSDNIKKTQDQESHNAKRKLYRTNEENVNKKKRLNEASYETNNNVNEVPESDIYSSDSAHNKRDLKTNNSNILVSIDGEIKKEAAGYDSMANDEIQCSAASNSEQSASLTSDTQKFSAASTAIGEHDQNELPNFTELSNDSSTNCISKLSPVCVGERSEDSILESGSRSTDFPSTIGEDDEIFDSQTLKEENSDTISQDNVSTQPLNIVDKISSLIENMSDKEISNMSQHEKYQLETRLMTFILHMRNVNPINP